jgi:autotransporter-associated beta strand protein
LQGVHGNPATETINSGGIFIERVSGTPTVNIAALHLNGYYELDSGLLLLGSNATGTGSLLFTGGTIQAGSTVTSSPSLSLSGTNYPFDTNGNTVTQSGQVTGAGGIYKTGNGSLILTNSINSYTGRTTISAGTLQVGDGTTSGNIPSATAIVDNAALVYDNVDNQTYAGTISGSGALVKLGAGNLVLSGTGTNTYTGGTLVTKGILEITNPHGLPNGKSLIVGAGASSVFAPSAPATVPEPSTFIMSVIAMIAAFIQRTRRR